MVSELWEWAVWIMNKAEEILKEQKAKWYQKNKSDPAFRERRQEAVDRYRERKMEEDPEGFKEFRKEIRRKSAKKMYRIRMDSMTEQELEEYRAKKAEEMRKYRARKKAEKLAMQEKEKSNE